MSVGGGNKYSTSRVSSSGGAGGKLPPQKRGEIGGESERERETLSQHYLDTVFCYM